MYGGVCAGWAYGILSVSTEVEVKNWKYGREMLLLGIQTKRQDFDLVGTRNACRPQFTETHRTISITVLYHILSHILISIL